MVVAAISSHNLLLWVGEVVGFAVLVWVFAGLRLRFLGNQTALGMAKSSLDARAARVDAQLRLAEESRAEAQKAHEEAQAEIVGAREEAARILERVEGIQVSLRAELAAAAEDQKTRIISQAREEIEAERNRAVLELRTKAADTAVEAAREVLRRTMDDATDREIIGRAMAQQPSSGDRVTS